MSNRDMAVAIIDSFPDNQLGNVVTMLQTMKQAIEDALTADIPNAATIAALKEGDEMLRSASNVDSDTILSSSKKLFPKLKVENGFCDEKKSRGTSELDDLFIDAVEVVIQSGQASVSMLQRRF